MVKKNKFARKPLMYIQQPSISSPKAKMQHSYQTSRKSARKQEQNTLPQSAQDKSVTKRTSKRKPVTLEQNETSAENKEVMQQAETENPAPMEEKPSFQDMTLEEKIGRLTKSTTHMIPKMRCAVETPGRTYRGIITDYAEAIVYMQVNRKLVKIPFEEIKDIRMLGF
ncbi:CotO family spore coat protein [Virgibacillus halophilus]|uniref:CotO family spore coat protein n=1 Tax=Tigheibacillus halophilus TaxID=361280 RepID=A0ABU5C9U9_9BACI|nr:CotO family spore coat protein [Virgibacillus halophilus]